MGHVLILGTPGVGKTFLARELAFQTGYKHIEVSKEVTENNLFTEYDEERKCTVFDEDVLYDHMQTLIEESDQNLIVDFHSVTPFDFQDGWFEVVVLLHASTDILFDRLTDRDYTEAKVQENVQCEIFEVIKEELLEALEMSLEDYEEALARKGKCTSGGIAHFEARHDTLEDHQSILDTLTAILKKN